MKVAHNPRRRKVRTLAVIVLFFAVLFLDQLPAGPEHWTADLRTTLLSPRSITQDRDISIVSVDEQCLKDRPYTSPIDRELLAEIISRVAAFHPKVVGLDIVFLRPTEVHKDDRLLEVISSVQIPIVLALLAPHSLSTEEREFQARFHASAKRTSGHIYFDTYGENPLIVSDNVVRRIAEAPLSISQRSFAEEILHVAGAKPQSKNGQHIRWLLAPRDGTELFPTIPCEFLLLPSSPEALDKLISGRIVLIGANFPDRDQHLTPLSVWSEQRFAGVEIHAQIVKHLLDGVSVFVFGLPLMIVTAILFIVIGYWCERLDSGENHLLLEVIGLVLLIVGSALAFWLWQVILPFVVCFIAWSLGLLLAYQRRH